MLDLPNIQPLYQDAPAISDWARNAALAERPFMALLLWALTFCVLGIIFRPLMPTWIKKLPDGGWLISKLCGWIVWALMGWWVASLQLASNRLPLYLFSLGLMALLALWAHKRSPKCGDKKTLIQMLGWEAFWLTTLAGAVVVRLLNPDLWHPYFGGEKFMELSMMHAVVRSPFFPPQDPYFAGEPVNYYYWGYQLFTPIIKLLGLPPTSAFNLAQPTTVAFAITLSAQCLTQLFKKPLKRSLLFGCVFAGAWIMLAGNPASIWPWEGYWDVSRRIGYTINEFPAWTFLFADLHPHSFNLLLGPAYVLTLVAAASSVKKVKTILGLLRDLAPPALLLSTLACCNTWDAPGYLLFTLAFLFFEGPRNMRRWIVALPIVGVLHLPFYLHYLPVGVSGLGVHRADTDPMAWLSMWGMHLLLGLLVPLLALPRLRVGFTGLITFAVTLTSAFFLALIGQPVSGILLFPLVFLIYQATVLKEPLLPLLIQGLGWCILLGVEWVYIKDFYDGGEYYRMNTVFKFGLQAWILLGLGISLHLLHAIDRHGIRRNILPIAIMLSGCFFLPWALPERINERMANPQPPRWTLDGTAFMEQGQFAWPQDLPEWDLAGERDALTWLRTQAADRPRIILEAPLGYYREMGCRTASLTGHLLPIGMHQYAEQRAPTTALPRQQAVDQLWLTSLPKVLLAQIDALQLEYIYVGALEKRTVRTATLMALKNLQLNSQLNIAFENDTVTIYERPRYAD